jgi:hypothetical protein
LAHNLASPSLGHKPKARVVINNDFEYVYKVSFCHNLNLGLATKAKAYKNASHEGSPGVTFHAKECEGMNPHIPKGTPTLGVGIPVDSQICKEQLQGSKRIALRHSLYHWKALGT